MAAYRKPLPNTIKNKLRKIDMRNHPAAKHKGSPIIGNQEKIKAGVPKRRNFSIARCRRVLFAAAKPKRRLIAHPNIHIAMAPSVLPLVATAHNQTRSSECAKLSAISATSEPPGNNVDERNALTNSPHHCHTSMTYTQLGLIDGMYYALV